MSNSAYDTCADLNNWLVEKEEKEVERGGVEEEGKEREVLVVEVVIAKEGVEDEAEGGEEKAIILGTYLNEQWLCDNKDNDDDYDICYR